MTWWGAGLAGLGGGLAVELVDLYKLVRASDGSYSLPVMHWGAYAIAVAIRLVLGFGAAWALYDADQIDTVRAGIGTAAGATGFFEHLGRSHRSPSQAASTAPSQEVTT
jgi:hypothetical protein